MKTIAGIGEILWDMFPQGKVLGGAPANFACHASQFGFEGVAVSAIGDDDLGREIIDCLSNIATKNFSSLLETVNFPTGTVQVTLNEKGVPQYEICENVAWDNIPFTSKTEALAKKCAAVCFGSLAQRNSISRTTILKFLELIPENALKIFDVNLRQHFYSKEIVHESLLKSNVLKINDEELTVVAELLGFTNLSEEEICKKLLDSYHLKMVIETKGENGSFVFTQKETSFFETPKVLVADTVGAGDSFTGAFVAALLKEKTIREAHELAVEVSAFVCTQHGATPKLPDNLIKQ
ncbi:MAG: carbohydrate kinase [Dysgonamonadaceae bacterium]|jgi:fructokinase|nr:carbohydrate kinase [Dysgonamonadaceae bacterium]